MAYRIEKDTGDLVIDGFETGIASSPHKGIANIQNANISTESGEITASFLRAQQTMTSTATGTGSLAFADSSHVSLSITNSNNFFKGNWITVTNSSHTGELPNGTYYVPPSTGTNFQLSQYYNVANYTLPATISYLIVGGGGNGSVSVAGGNGGGGGGGGEVKTGSVSATAQAYTITVGAAATNSSAFSVTANKGSDGGTATVNNGGAGGNSGNGHTGGTGGSGNAGGPNGGGGGAGDSANGSNGAAGTTGANGGNGTASSITGTPVTYSGGGGGKGSVTQGTGGTGGGGNGGANGTANTGGGGGGDGTGGSGIVVISYPINSILGATGGTITYTTTNKIHTFTSSGTFTVPTPVPMVMTGFTAGLTATIQLVANMGAPLAQATETYYLNGTTYNRYYVLDSNNLVWVYDTQNETTYSSTDNVSWFLPDFQTGWCTGATGIGVISGMLVAAAKTGLYGKPVVLLGNTNSTATTWTQFALVSQWQGSATNSPHFCYVGHQGKMYVTDGSYISSIFPDSTIADTSGGNGNTQDNVQTLCSWIIDPSGTPTEGDATVISGTSIALSDGGRLPVVFFTKNGGTLPSYITAGKVYYIRGDSTKFFVYPTTTIPDNIILTLSGVGSTGDTSATITTNWIYPTGTYIVAFSNGDIRNVSFTNGTTNLSWSGGLTSSTTTSITAAGTLDIATGASGTQYFMTFYPIASASGYGGTTPTLVFSPQRLTLPNFEVAQTIGEIGNIALIGCGGNIVYPWNQVDNLPGGLINLPEGNVADIVTVNQMAYLFAGNNGNIYITDGSTASLVINIPDYVAGVPGSPATYIEPQYVWGGAMYLRGRVYFSVLDQTATKAGNCGGVWSFVPTQNLYIGQDTGIALRLEASNSYQTYNGDAPLLITKLTQNATQPLYWSVWASSISSPAYGIDYSTNGTSSVAPYVVETDAVPVGTMLQKRTFQQFEYKLAAPLDQTATVAAKYRTELTAAWSTVGTFEIDSTRLSGYVPQVVEKAQWLQLQFTVTPATSSASTNTFARLREIRIR